MTDNPYGWYWEGEDEDNTFRGRFYQKDEEEED